MRINTNVSALNTQRALQGTNAAASRAIGRLSSGFRINRAADDAAGLGIANSLHADVRSLRQASRNAEQANSMLQVMEGAASQIQGILERMKELAAQSNSDTVDSTGRTRLNTEFTSLRSEIDRIVSTTEFSNKKLLDGSFGSGVDTANSTLVSTAGNDVYSADLNGTSAGTYTVTLTSAGTPATGTFTMVSGSTTQVVTATSAGKQSLTFSTFGVTLNLTAGYALADTFSTNNLLVVTAGSNGGQFMVSSSGAYSSTTGDLVQLDSIDVDVATLGLTSDSLTSAANAQTALTNIDTAISTLNTALGKIGAAQNRIGFSSANVKSAVENIAAAESIIRDADMAAEMTEFSRLQILQQAGTAMLAQANSAPNLVLRLLQG